MTKQNKGKILIVEDEVSLRKVLVDKLNSEGFEPLEATNGQEGLDKALKEKPDLILLDILMPVMDGLTMIKNLREDAEYGKTVPVILLTNLSADTEDIIKRIAETEPAYYIVKASMTMGQIIDKIKDRLKHSK